MPVDFSRLPREKLIALLLESQRQAEAAKAEAAASKAEAVASKAEAAAAQQHAAEVEVRLDLSEKKYAAAVNVKLSFAETV